MNSHSLDFMARAAFFGAEYFRDRTDQELPVNPTDVGIEIVSDPLAPHTHFTIRLFSPYRGQDKTVLPLYEITTIEPSHVEIVRQLQGPTIAALVSAARMEVMRLSYGATLSGIAAVRKTVPDYPVHLALLSPAEDAQRAAEDRIHQVHQRLLYVLERVTDALSRFSPTEVHSHKVMEATLEYDRRGHDAFTARILATAGWDRVNNWLRTRK